MDLSLKRRQDSLYELWLGRTNILELNESKSAIQHCADGALVMLLKRPDLLTGHGKIVRILCQMATQKSTTDNIVAEDETRPCRHHKLASHTAHVPGLDFGNDEISKCEPAVSMLTFTD
jgi:hypothetical protein